MRIAAIQSDIAWEDPQANFQRLEPWIETAAKAGARLVALPEMFSHGFSMQTEKIREEPEGPSTLFLRQQAGRHGLWVAGSIPEILPGDDKPFNTLLLAGPGGELHRYRKIHPFSHVGEDRHYQAGSERISFTIEGLRITPFICYDLRFADEFWGKATATDLYLVIANWPEPRRHHWTSLLQARAIENQAYVLGVNRVGDDPTLHYCGDSRIIDPIGRTLAAAAEGETLLLADVDPDVVHQTRATFPFLNDRR
jgi:predicted amidohydrolase